MKIMSTLYNYFIILTNLFIYICILSLSNYQARLRENLMHLFLLQWAISCAFSVLDILGFFVFFLKSMDTSVQTMIFLT